MKPKIFIDGSWGTTGLKIQEKLSKHPRIDLIGIAEEEKKNTEKKLAIIKQSDLIILCLPDKASQNITTFIEKKNVKIIDTSSTNRTNNNWCYGFPEMSKNQRKTIKNSKKVSNVGCYAVASISLLRPLLSCQLVSKEHFFTIHAISGYSGGGKKLIAEYNEQKLPTQTYGLNQNHKHIPEIMKYSGLLNQPYFLPSVGDFKQGMIVHIPLFSKDLQNKENIESVFSCYQSYYNKEKFIEIDPIINSKKLLKNSFLQPTLCNDTNYIKIGIFGNKNIFSLVAILDNLGKGASGSAIQNLNLMLGFEETTGLI